MAVIGTASSSQSSSIGLWCEVTPSAALTLSASGTTAHTIVLATTGNSSLFNTNLPIAVTGLAPGTFTSAAGVVYNPIYGGSNTGWPATTVGTGAVTQSGGTVTITFVNSGAATTITAGTRILLVQNAGV